MQAKESSVWLCGVCNSMYSTKDAADSCCLCTVCGKGSGSKGHTKCPSCADAAELKWYADRIASLEIVDESQLGDKDVVFLGGDVWRDTDKYLDECICYGLQPEQYLEVGRIETPLIDSEDILIEWGLKFGGDLDILREMSDDLKENLREACDSIVSWCDSVNAGVVVETGLKVRVPIEDYTDAAGGDDE